MSKRETVELAIGKRVHINGRGDLRGDGDHNHLVENYDLDIRVVKWTKGGMVEVIVDEKHHYVLPPDNITYISEWAGGDDQPDDDQAGPDLCEWHKRGIEMGATHLIVSHDQDEPFQPHFVMPTDELRDVEHRICGGGHIFDIYNLAEFLTQEQVDRFYKYVV